MSNERVYIGIGHGGSDSGAVANGLAEKDINLTIGTSIYKELKRHGVVCMLSRDKDVTESLSAKINECNNYKPTLALDIHCNAGGGDGFEAFHHYKGGRGKTLALNIEEEVKKIGQNSRGCKTRLNSDGQDYYGFIRSVACPSIIVECAFLDSKDRYIIDTIAEQVQFGVAIAKGILKTLGIQYKNSDDGTLVTKPNTKFYRVITGSYKEYKNAQRRVGELRAKGFESFIEEKK